MGTPAKPRADVSSYWACHWLHDFFFSFKPPTVNFIEKSPRKSKSEHLNSSASGK